ncbi:unnamed protein product [Owenia fusiformis]|uniref:Peptidase M14 domain-containing protein n=1 Tax=Owenia fusiformis TaxID=6347 RepID=A0A8J1XSZ9_OWEFU|nr:unnamed protein product [Owenia fusiformis]
MLLWAILALFAVASAKDYTGYQVLSVEPRDVNDLEFLRQLGRNREMKINFWEEPVRVARVSFHVPPVSSMMVKQVLADNGIPFSIVYSNLQQRIDEVDAARIAARFNADPTNYILSDYQRPATINAWLDTLGNQYSQATVRSIGTSTEGRDMKTITISTGTTGRRSVLIDCGIHAREWITVSTCIYIIQTLLEQYGSNPEVTSVLDRYDFYVLPVTNPDGYEFTFENGTQGDRLWRKTRSVNAGEEDDDQCWGTDANRNFDSFWGDAGADPDIPCSDVYPGTQAFSEPETRALRDWALSIPNKILFLNIHCFTQLWLVPYGYHPSTPYPEDYDELVRVANIGVAALQAVNGLEFEVGTPPDILYEVSGGALDWAKITGGFKYSYSPELRPESPFDGGFILPPGDILPAGREVFAALLSHCNEMQ